MRNHRKERFLESQIISSIISEISFDSESWRLWEPKSKGLIFHKSVLSSTLHLAFWWTQLVMWRRYSCWFHTIHTYTHTHVHTHARTWTPAHAHTHPCTYAHKGMHTHAHTKTHTHVHMHTHTHVHTCMHKMFFNLFMRPALLWWRHLKKRKQNSNISYATNLKKILEKWNPDPVSLPQEFKFSLKILNLSK